MIAWAALSVLAVLLSVLAGWMLESAKWRRIAVRELTRPPLSVSMPTMLESHEPSWVEQPYEHGP